VAIRHPEAAALCERLIQGGVVPDFRAPDSIRFGMSPLTTRFRDVHRGLATLRGLCRGD
jgi:kynureninase